MKSCQRSGFLPRGPIRWVRGASSGSDRQATSILVSIGAETASQSIVRAIGMKSAHSLEILTVTNVGGGASSECVADGKTGKPPNDGGHRTPGTADPVNRSGITGVDTGGNNLIRGSGGVGHGQTVWRRSGDEPCTGLKHLDVP